MSTVMTFQININVGIEIEDQKIQLNDITCYNSYLLKLHYSYEILSSNTPEYFMEVYPSIFPMKYIAHLSLSIHKYVDECVPDSLFPFNTGIAYHYD